MFYAPQSKPNEIFGISLFILWIQYNHNITSPTYTSKSTLEPNSSLLSLGFHIIHKTNYYFHSIASFSLIKWIRMNALKYHQMFVMFWFQRVNEHNSLTHLFHCSLSLNEAPYSTAIWMNLFIFESMRFWSRCRKFWFCTTYINHFPIFTNINEPVTYSNELQNLNTKAFITSI